MLSPLLIQCDNTFKQSLLFPFTVTLTNIADAAAAPAVDACFVYFWHNNSLFIGIESRCDFSKEYIRQRKLTFVSSSDCITRTAEVIQRTKKKINTIDDVNGWKKKLLRKQYNLRNTSKVRKLCCVCAERERGRRRRRKIILERDVDDFFSSFQTCVGSFNAVNTADSIFGILWHNFNLLIRR